MKIFKLKKALFLFLALAITIQAPAQYVGADRIKKGTGIVADANNKLAADTALFSGVYNDNSIILVHVATTAVLPGSPTYNNGAAGVGATLTRGSAGTLGTIDGVTSFSVGDSILVKNQAAQLQNGVYIVTDAGGGTAYVLTRKTTSDETVELDAQLVKPIAGTTNATLIFGQTTADPVVGTDPIVYANAGLYVTQAAAGTQAVNQIPYYTATARRITKGEAEFNYNPVGDVLNVRNITVGDGTTGIIVSSDGNTQITFDQASSGLLMTTTAGEISMSNANGSVIVTGAGSTSVTAGNGGDLFLTVSSGAGHLDFNTVAGNADFTGVTGDILLPGNASFSGGKLLMARAIMQAMSTTAAAGDLTVPNANMIEITGNTQINAITVTGLQAGYTFSLSFTGTPTVKNNTAGGAGTAVILLAGGADFVASANDVLTLFWNGAVFLEVSRSVN